MELVLAVELVFEQLPVVELCCRLMTPAPVTRMARLAAASLKLTVVVVPESAVAYKLALVLPVALGLVDD